MAIIGLSGAGKSTLIRTINRMIDVTSGQLIVDGTDVMTLKGRAMRRFRRKIGMIFQSYNLVTRATAIKTSFECRRATEELCRRCGYATRFSQL